jgi:hypothetical protein
MPVEDVMLLWLLAFLDSEVLWLPECDVSWLR